MNKQFIVKEVKKYLVSLGLDELTAARCAEQGGVHWLKRVANSRDPFKEACDHAGQKAMERDMKFKYKSPKAATKRRTKKPQEAFNFD